MLESNTNYFIHPGGALKGTLQVPGDKSISHRAVMLAAIAEGTTTIQGFLEGADCLATLKAFQAMGVRVEQRSSENLSIFGVGLQGLQPPQQILDLGNSGTSIRLLAGLLAGQTFASELTGDESLRRRPMARVVDPLRLMGAQISLQTNGCPPIAITGGQLLHGISYPMPIASAQVKSAILLAGLYALGTTEIIEPAPSRDHTERMLASFGYPIQQNSISLPGQQKLTATTIQIPGDLSSAAFFLVGASIAEGSDLILQGVGINPTRSGVITLLQAMGADIHLLNERFFNNEPVADLCVRSSELHGITITAEMVPLAIDEFPILFIAAACAKGETIVHGAQELRVKESDRIQTMVTGLQALGIDAQATADGARIKGGVMHGGTIDSHGDHRIAMAFAMAGLKAQEPITILNCANVSTSFPNFVALAKEAGLGISSSPTLPHRGGGSNGSSIN